MAEERAREAESDARNLERRLGDGGSKEERMELRVTQRHAVDCRRDCDVLKKLAERKRKLALRIRYQGLIYGSVRTNNYSY